MDPQIAPVVRTLRRGIRSFREPSVTAVARDRDPFKVLVSCILSLRTKDAVTTAASKRLFALAGTPEKLLALTEKRIQKAIYPVAFYRVKARNLKKVCTLLLEKYKGKVPATMGELLTLPNVGRKTANIVLTLGFKKYGIAVDTHVHRISNRLGIVKTKTPEATEFALREALPKRYWMEYNDLLVTWGQNVCAPVSPWCSRCVLKPLCRRVGVKRSR